MSKTKKSGASHYEVLFIIPNKFTEDESKKVSEKIEKILTENGGKITLREYWGKKRLAYEIKHNTFGYYGLFEFDLEGSYLAKINKDLRLSTEVLRHQIVVKKVKSEEELERQKKIQAKIDSKKAENEKEEKEKNKKLVSSSSSKSREDVQVKAAPKKDDQRADLKDLDKKLEGILNADDLI